MKAVLNFLNKPLNTGNLPEEQNAVLNKKFQELEHKLKTIIDFLKQKNIRVRGEKINLYTLPWFLLLGNTDSGKSALLANAGIKYVLGKKATRSNVLPHSEYGDWWVTANSVLVDLPGSYINHQDKITSLANKLWQHFLSSVKTLRGAKAINGVIVTLSIAELMDKEQRQMNIENITHAITMLKNTFGEDLPVYVVITKCDLLPGFIDFFNHYGSNELAQTCGLNLDIQENENIIEVFTKNFDTLIKKLNQQLISRLHQERDPYAKLYIKDFPLHLERLKEVMKESIKSLTYDILPHSFKGIFLTSATQPRIEETVIDRQMIVNPELPSLTIMQAPPSISQPYFIKQFLLQTLNINEAPITQNILWVSHIAWAAILSILIICVMWCWQNILPTFTQVHHISTVSTNDRG